MTDERIGGGYVEARVDTSGLDRDLNRLEQNFGQRMTSLGKKMQSVGKDLTMRVTAPIVGAGVAMARTASSFDAEMSKIVGLVGVSRDQVDSWGREIIKLAPQLGRAPQELAEGLFFVTSAGFRGAEAMDVLKTAAKAASAGLGDTATIADAVTSAVNAYGKENLSAGSAADILTAAVREGKLEASQLAPVLGRLLPTSSAMGISFENVAGILAVFSRTGADAAEGATSLQAIMSTIQKPSKAAAETMAEVGLSAGQLRDMAAEPGGLIEVMRLLESSFAGNDEALATVVPNVRAFRGVMNVLAQETDIVDGVINGVTESTGALEHAFSEAADTAEFKWNSAMGELQSSSILFGRAIAEGALPWVENFAGGISSLAEKFADLDEGQQQALIGLAAGIAAIGPSLWIFGTLVRSIGEVAQGMQYLRQNGKAGIEFLGTWISMVREARQAGQGWGSILSQMVNPAILGVGVVLAAGALVLNEWRKSKERAKRISEEFKSTLDAETGAVTDNTRATVAKRLADEGGIEAAAKFGLTLKDLVDAALGNEDAMARLQAATQESREEHVNWGGTAEGAKSEGDKLIGTIEQLAGIYEHDLKVTKEVTQATREATDATGEQEDAIEGLIPDVKDLTSEMKEQKSIADLLKGSFDMLTGSVISADRAAINAREQFVKLTEVVMANGEGLDIHTEHGRENKKAILDTVEAIQNHMTALAEDGATMDELGAVFDAHIEDFENTLRAAGFTEEQIAGLIDRYNLVPERIMTDIIIAGVEQAGRDIIALNEHLRSIGSTLRAVGGGVYIKVDEKGQQQGIPFQHTGGVLGRGGAPKWHGERPLSHDEEVFVGRHGERVLTRDEARMWDDLSGHGSFAAVGGPRVSGGMRLTPTVTTFGKERMPPQQAGGGARSFPGGGGAIGKLIGYMRNAGVPHVVTSTKRSGGGSSLHNVGRAVDFSIGGHGNRGYGAPGLRNMFQAFRPVENQLAELILAGAPYNIKNGRRVGGYAWGRPGQRGNHWNHLHSALENGGVFTEPTLGLLGETPRARPEIVAPQPIMRETFREVLGEQGGKGPVAQFGDVYLSDEADVDMLTRKLEYMAQAGRL